MEEAGAGSAEWVVADEAHLDAGGRADAGGAVLGAGQTAATAVDGLAAIAADILDDAFSFGALDADDVVGDAFPFRGGRSVGDGGEGHGDGQGGNGSFGNHSVTVLLVQQGAEWGVGLGYFRENWASSIAGGDV